MIDDLSVCSIAVVWAVGNMNDTPLQRETKHQASEDGLVIPWFTAGTIFAVFKRVSVLVIEKLQTPIALTRPFSTRPSIA